MFGSLLSAFDVVSHPNKTVGVRITRVHPILVQTVSHIAAGTVAHPNPVIGLAEGAPQAAIDRVAARAEHLSETRFMECVTALREARNGDVVRFGKRGRLGEYVQANATFLIFHVRLHFLLGDFFGVLIEDIAGILVGDVVIKRGRRILRRCRMS